MDNKEHEKVVQFMIDTCSCCIFNGQPCCDSFIMEQMKKSRKIELFVENGCTWNGGTMCSLIFSIDHISSVHDQCSSFQRGELNNILLGHMLAMVCM